MRIAREEVFGESFCLIPFTDEEEAIAIGNASIVRSAPARASGPGTSPQSFASALGCAGGTVWINTYRRPRSYAAPVRRSPGKAAWAARTERRRSEEYTEVKSVWIDSGNRVHFPVG